LGQFLILEEEAEEEKVLEYELDICGAVASLG
jgi:hypothetical protein